MREGDVRSPVPGGGGTSTSSAWERERDARRGRETTEKPPQWYTREANVEVREDAGLKVFRKEGEMRIPARGGDKEGGEGSERNGRERERVAKETKEKETAIDSVPRCEARGNDMRRRTASTRSRIGVAGAVPTSLSPHSGAPMAAGGNANLTNRDGNAV